MLFFAAVAFSAELTCQHVIDMVSSGMAEGTIISVIQSSQLSESDLECYRSSNIPIDIMLAIGKRIEQQRTTVAQTALAKPEYNALTTRAWFTMLNVEMKIGVIGKDNEIVGTLIDVTQEDITLRVGEDATTIDVNNIVSVQRVDGRPVYYQTEADIEEPYFEHEDNNNLPIRPQQSNDMSSRKKTGIGLLIAGGAMTSIGLIALSGYAADTGDAMRFALDGDADSTSAEVQNATQWIALYHLSIYTAPPLLLGGVLCLTIPVPSDR